MVRCCPADNRGKKWPGTNESEVKKNKMAGIIHAYLHLIDTQSVSYSKYFFSNLAVSIVLATAIVFLFLLAAVEQVCF